MGGIVVLVPHDEGVTALAEVEGVEIVRYDPGEELPPAAEQARVLMPPFLAPVTAVPLRDAAVDWREIHKRPAVTAACRYPSRS